MSQEFKDSLDNNYWTYNHTILKMMADLNSKTLVTLGDCRRKANLEGKILKEHEEWEKYRRENKNNYPQVKLQRLKVDKVGSSSGSCGGKFWRKVLGGMVSTLRKERRNKLTLACGRRA